MVLFLPPAARGAGMMAPAATGPRIESLDISSVWAALGGGPLRGNRGRAFWRAGHGYNVALDTRKGTWFDHAAVAGGGILALVELARDCDRRAALGWLSDRFGIASGVRSLEERRDYSRRLESARMAAAALVERRGEAFNLIREAKRQKLEEYHRLNCAAHEAEDIELLAAAEDVWALLEALDVEGDALLSETDSAKLAAMLAERGAA